MAYPDEQELEHGIRAIELWRDLERETGTTVLLSAGGGGLSVGTGIEREATLLRAAGREAQLLSLSDVALRWPCLTLKDGGPALHQRDSGVILASVAVATLLASARNAGAVLSDRRPVRAVDPHGESVRIETGSRSVNASCAIVTAGPWSRRLLGPLGISLDVRICEQTVAWFQWDGPAPPILLEYDDPRPYWLLDPGRGLKAALHVPGPWIADPDEPGGDGDQGDIRRIAQWAATCCPSIDPRPLTVETCRYTWADDERFVLERHGNVVVGSACSGRGFQYAMHTGELLADLST